MASAERARASLASAEAAARSELLSLEDLDRWEDAEAPWRARRMLSNVSEHIRGMPALWEEIEAASEEAISPEQEKDLIKEAERWKSSYESLKQDWRKSQLIVRQKLSANQTGARQELLKNARTDVEDVSKSTKDTLYATRAMMEEELGRGEAALGAIQESERILRKAHQEVKGQRPLLQTSKKLLQTIYRNDLSERASIYAGFTLFMSVVTYILVKRLLGINLLHVPSLWHGQLNGEKDVIWSEGQDTVFSRDVSRIAQEGSFQKEESQEFKSVPVDGTEGNKEAFKQWNALEVEEADRVEHHHNLEPPVEDAADDQVQEAGNQSEEMKQSRKTMGTIGKAPAQGVDVETNTKEGCNDPASSFTQTTCSTAANDKIEDEKLHDGEKEYLSVNSMAEAIDMDSHDCGEDLCVLDLDKN